MDSTNTKPKVVDLNSIPDEDTQTLELLLKRVCQQTGATPGYRFTEPGFFVNGTFRKYFVESSSLRVFNTELDQYFSVVDKGEQTSCPLKGMITRLLALHNDAEVASQVTTLQPFQQIQQYGN